MEKVGLSEFLIIEKDLKQLIGAKINQTTVINSRSFSITFSMIKNEKLFISLDHQKPFLCLISSSESVSTIISTLNDTLRKYIRDSYVLDVSLLNNDRVVKFKLQKPNELFEKEQFSIIFEFIPQKPNMIIVDDKDNVIFALHYSSALSKRTLIQGIKYEAPSRNEISINPSEHTLEEIKQFGVKVFLESLQKRKEEKYEPLFKFTKIRIKSLQKKLKILDSSIEEAKNKLKYQDHGNMILAYSQNIDDVISYIKENNIKYDETLSPGINANTYFKIFKKAKRTIEMNEIEIEKCKNEISYLESILTSSQYMNDDEIVALAEEIMPHKYENDKKHPKSVMIGSISNNGTTIYFGKNAKSNDKLTFSISEKTDTFMHIKDYHGSHILIKSKSPSDEDLLLGAEIALIMSNKDTAEVYYTTINNVKKGGKPGLVNLLSYKTIFLKNVRQETKDLISKYKNL